MKIKEWLIRRCASLARALRGEVSTEYLIKHGLTVGNNFSRQGGVRIDSSYPFLIEMGDDVGLSTDVTILAHDNSLKRFIGIAKLGRVKIGNHVMVGSKSTILANVQIGDNVVIGAGSVVTKDIPSNSVAAGNPARVLCTIDEYITKYRGRICDDNLLGREFTPLLLNDEKKARIKELCKKGFCYMKAENFDKLNK